MVIAAAPLIRFDLPSSACHRGDDGECVAQSVYVLPENRRWLPGVFTAADSIMTLFERLVAPFPYEKLAHLQSSTRFGGMENASAIFYNGKLFPTRTLTDATVAHEMAHQWFGDAVTEREWAHLWLSEGFADYFAALWAREAHGERGFREELAKLRAKVIADTVVAARPVIDTAQTNHMALLNTNSYDKGAFVLAMLHHELGDSAFFRGIRSYYAEHRHGTALSDDLRRELEQQREDDERHVDRPVLESNGEDAGHGDGDADDHHDRAQRGREARAHERGARPSRTASSAAFVRSFTWSFRKMLATWFLTVCSLMERRRPISRFDSPVARSLRISSSRAVRPASCSRRFSSARSRSNSRSTRPAISPDSIGSPAAARSTVSRISSGDAFLSR
jgi:hypothetical protein